MRGALTSAAGAAVALGEQSTGGFNDRGEATVLDVRHGWSERTAGVWRAGGGITPLASLAGDDRGQVVGVSGTAGGDDHAFPWEGGEMTDLGILVGDAVHSEASDVNERGQVVGVVGGDGGGSVLWTTLLPP